jgi:hypothetical protein
MADFHLEIDSLGARHGWMNCWLVLDGHRHQMDATSVFLPFCDVLKFTRAIAANSLPHEFFWEEEGHGAKIQALVVNAESSKFHLRINHDGEVVVDAELDRMQVVRGLLESLRNFSLDCPGAESEWEFPYFLVEKFERDLAQGVPTHSEDNSVNEIHFVFGHYGGYGGQVHPAITMWINEWETLYLPMKDIPRFWWMWFEWFEKIGIGDFPAEAVFHVEDEDHRDDSDIMILLWDSTHHFQAESTADTNCFRMKLDILSAKPEFHISPIVDKIFNRREFVGAFVDAFQNFMRTSYPAFLESEENKFDLTVLPLKKLISTLD